MEAHPKPPEKDTTSHHEPLPRVSAKKYRGLGDVVHAVAAPVAKLLDLVTKTNFGHCQGCASRRDELNRMVPFSSPDN